MHEWALAESVILSIEENSLKNKKIRIIVGELQSIDREIFKFAIDEILKQKKYNLDYKIKVEKAGFKCNNCGNKFSISEVLKKTDDERENIHFVPEMVKAFVKCPKCKSVDFEIIKGRGVSLSYEK
ncbi:MAG: hydrogenase nickel incorporation protein HypA [Elusimicrobiota bacterium]